MALSAVELVVSEIIYVPGEKNKKVVTGQVMLESMCRVVATVMMHGRKRCQIWPVFPDAGGSRRTVATWCHVAAVPGVGTVGLARPARRWLSAGRSHHVAARIPPTGPG